MFVEKDNRSMGEQQEKMMFISWLRLVSTAAVAALFLLSCGLPTSVDGTNGRSAVAPRKPGRFARTPVGKEPPFTIANMTCESFLQPLNHFDLPRNKSGFFQQRFCYYNGFVKPSSRSSSRSSSSSSSPPPVFLYTGNESPLEQYINQTGLIWESAPQFGAQVIFVEHRYEGQSLPNPDMPHCLAYAASYQALADYANFIENYIFGVTPVNGKSRKVEGVGTRRPVIVFGGSYGGMLSAWMRMLYPHLVTGAMAASAPIGGFPTNRPKSIDSAYTVIQHGLQQAYPPTSTTTKTSATVTTNDENDDDNNNNNHCSDNLLAAWPLIDVLSREKTGRQLLQESFRLCQLPPSDSQVLTSWAQSPWFDMAEGSFPYPSSYITFALTHKLVKLPAWPLQAACWKQSNLHQDWDIRFTGSQSDVLYNITYGDSGLTVEVDWDQATPVTPCRDQRQCLDALRGSESVRGLLESVRNAVSVWFNVTKDISCYNLTAAPNEQESYLSPPPQHQTMPIQPVDQKAKMERRLRSRDDSAAEKCLRRMRAGSWPSLCCNEEMNLIITDASGLGHDSFWPPSHPRGTESYADIYPSWSGVYEFCRDPDGIYGFPQSTPDPWATWMDIRYGGLHVSSHSNIIFSNGLLDPWSAAGVYAKGGYPAERPSDDKNDPLWRPYKGIDGLYVQNITGDDDSMIALILEAGGHHTDLMYSDPADPPSIRGARELQRDYMRQWINAFWKQQEVQT